MRLVLFAQDDSAAECLSALAATTCEVLGVAASGGATAGQPCSIFARRCVELGFSFVSLDSAASAASVVENFKPELLVCVPDLGSPSEMFTDLPAERKCLARVGASMPGAPWPEFGPIWLDHPRSRVALVSAGTSEELAACVVPVAEGESALTLRMKHATAVATLVVALAGGGEVPKAAVAEDSAVLPEAPQQISLDWDEVTVDRYVRAHFLPPRDAAVVEDPSRPGDNYFIESVEQYKAFRQKVLQDLHVGNNGPGPAYAADTHWYSNLGGSIVKMGDSDIHMPVRTADKKRMGVVPGAALGARKKLRMNEPLIGPNAERYCTNALASSWIGVEGPHVKRLERQLAQICGCSAACAVQSGTAALYGAMKALGVSDPCHHVLVPAFTCAACADAIVHAGGRPIPIDCETDSYGISLEAARRGLEQDKDVVGIVVAPCYGVPARDFNQVLALCKEHGLWICEDACETYGAFKAQPPGADGPPRVPVGALSTLTVVSIRSEKMIGVGEGGAILGNDATLVARAKWWCSRAPCRGVGLWRVYEHEAVGQNFRLPEMLAAVGCAAAEMLPTMIERKRSIHGWYEKYFAAKPTLQKLCLQKEAPGDESVWWINSALLPEGMSGEKVGMQLMAKYPDIEIRPGFFPLNMMGIFKSSWQQPCPNAEELYQRLVCLPSSNLLTEPDVQRVCEALVDVIEQMSTKSSSCSSP